MLIPLCYVLFVNETLSLEIDWIYQFIKRRIRINKLIKKFQNQKFSARFSFYFVRNLI